MNLIAATLDQRGRGPTDQVMMNLQLARPVVGTSYKGHDDDTDTLLVTGPLRSNAYNNSDPTMEVQQLIVGPLGGGNDGIGRRTEDDPNLVIDGWHGTVERGLVSPLCAKGTGGHNADSAPIIAHTLTAPDPKDGSRQDKIPIVLAHTLQAEGADASEDGTGRGTPLVTGFAQNQRGELRTMPISSQLTAGGGKPGEGYAAAQIGTSVRRLTPTECERLQGFPDGWTCLCGSEPYSIATCKCPDSARYRAMGNAVTVPVIEWIGRRLMALLTAPSNVGRAG